MKKVIQGQSHVAIGIISREQDRGFLRQLALPLLGDIQGCQRDKGQVRGGGGDGVLDVDIGS